jgi:hypothetical protein
VTELTEFVCLSITTRSCHQIAMEWPLDGELIAITHSNPNQPVANRLPIKGMLLIDVVLMCVVAAPLTGRYVALGYV